MLGLQWQPSQGLDLRLDGYYYKYNYRYKDGIGVTIFFFYKNGVVMDGGYTNLSSLDEYEKCFKTGSYYRWHRDDRTTWGVHRIEDDKIQFEKWTHYNQLRERFLRSGKILNDTTFVITKVLIRGDVRYPKMAADTFHFKQFSPKPDSINAFILVD